MSAAARRLPLLAAGAVSLVTGIVAGEGRMGWPVGSADLSLVHGPLMICGFFGTVIGLERAVALAKPWGWGAPAFTALGGIALLAGQASLGAALLLAGSLVFAAMSAAVIARQREVFTLILGLGGLAWAAGNLQWAQSGDAAASVPAWSAFLVLTIAGERLELSRFLPPWKWRMPTLIPPLLLMVAGAVLGSWPWFGAGLALLTLWSLGNDVVRRTIRQTGLTRYVAICLLSGYAWALAGGLLMTRLAPGETGVIYDAALHTLFVGFVFAMVFGHAPVILPAVLRVAVPFKPVFYLPLALLHGSLLLRVSGDLADLLTLRQWGGLLNAAAIAVFVVTMLVTVLGARKR
jgi:hypothetical protein